MALLGIMAVGFAAILARLVQLQVADASTYLELAQSQRLRPVDLPATRGTIFDRDMHQLAISIPARKVFADPGLVNDAGLAASVVASVLDLDEDEVQAAIAEAPEGNRYVPLADGVLLEDADRLRQELDAAGVEGIAFLEETARYYPSGDLASHVVGFVGMEGHGLEGLERQHDELLAGKEGHAVVERDPDGTLIPQAANQTTPPVPGDDLVLTIDAALQFRVQAALEAAVRAEEAKGGTLVVLDPATGDILAMANYPTYDLNDFRAVSPEVRRNRAITDAYEPGSVNKVIVASAAVAEGTINLYEKFTVPDELEVGDFTYHDAHVHPPERMTLADIVAYSSNVGAIQVALDMGANTFGSYLGRFGFTTKVGVGFPGETNGILEPVGSWTGNSLPSITIGQGIAVSPLQMAAVYATIANGGVYVQPRLVRGTVDPEGTFHPAEASATRRVISEDAAGTVAEMLAFAVEVGTGGEAQIPGFWVAGKTGTAQKPLPDGTGYSQDQFWASFIGFTPATRPAFVVAVVLDEPLSRYGGLASAPAFRDVARFALSLFRVPQAAKPPTPPHAVPTG